MKLRHLTCVLAALSLTVLGPALAAGDEGFAGYWKGGIETPGGTLEIMIDIAKAADGQWNARIDVPIQSIRKSEMIDVAVADGVATFAIDGVPGKPTFSGKLSEDGTTLSGDFNQGSNATTFSMTRAEKPADYDVDIYADFRKDGKSGEGLAGDWRALLVSGPHKLRFVLSVSAGEAGLAGKIVNLDQGNMEAEVSEIVVGDDGAVSFNVPLAQSSFSGTMNADGSAISGTWTQGNGTLALEFRRTDN